MNIHDVAQAITEPARAVPPIRLRWGVVTDVAMDGTLTIAIGGSATTVSGIVALDHVTAAEGDTVCLITDGVDVLVLGTVGA